MDDRRFDAFARSLATPKTRRGLLGALAALAASTIGASAQSCPPGQTANRKGDCSCPPGTDACPNGCFDLKKDPSHCGRCDRTCLGGECRKGECRCPAGTVLCAGVCRTQASFAADPNNCGGCGRSCDDGSVCTTDTCSGGVCLNTPIVCDDGNPCTANQCIDPFGCLTEEISGGACTTATGAAGTCASGTCEATTTTSAPTTTTTPTPTTTTTATPTCVGATPGTAQCATSANCPSGQECVNGGCFIPCTSDAACNVGDACTDCGCERVFASGDLYCVDNSTSPGFCAPGSCPAATICLDIPDGEFQFRCVRPCPTLQ